MAIDGVVVTKPGLTITLDISGFNAGMESLRRTLHEVERKEGRAIVDRPLLSDGEVLDLEARVVDG